MVEEKDSKLSIMIIPKTKKVKKFTIPNWLPKFILMAIIIITISIFFFFNRKNCLLSNLERDNKEQIEQIADLEKRKLILEKANEENDSTITELETKKQNLNEKVREVEIKFSQIDKLKQKLEKMANTN